MAKDWGFQVRELPVQMHDRQGGVPSANSVRSAFHLARLFMVIALHRVRRPLPRRGGHRRMTRLEVVVLVTAIGLLAIIIEIVRRRRLSENWAMLWITVAVGVLLIGVARPVIDLFSEAVGISYGASLVFAAGIVFLLFVCISLSMHVSRLEEKVEALAGEIALLRGIGDESAAAAARDRSTLRSRVASGTSGTKGERGRSTARRQRIRSAGGGAPGDRRCSSWWVHPFALRRPVFRRCRSRPLPERCSREGVPLLPPPSRSDPWAWPCSRPGQPRRWPTWPIRRLGWFAAST